MANKLFRALKNFIKYATLPGADIFTRIRGRLRTYWQIGEREVLDAGCGNGWFSYLAYKSGATVLAVSFDAELIAKDIAFYNGFLKIPKKRVTFEQQNLYGIGNTAKRFDEIICYETLEHIKDDRKICENFFRILKPGGILHLCCPNAEHWRWRAEKLDAQESGGHVRAGYTVESYEKLLRPIGFEIVDIAGVGGALAVYWQENIQAFARRILGEFGATIVAIVGIPILKLDSLNPKVPFSLYVKVRKGG